MCVFLLCIDGTGIQDIKQIAREGLTEALQPFDGLVQRAWQALHMHVVTQCFTILQAVRGITATYRMTNKRPPERASPFVVKILDPLRALEPDVKDRYEMSPARNADRRLQPNYHNVHVHAQNTSYPGPCLEAECRPGRDGKVVRNRVP